MNHTETGELLARIQVHDNRQLGEVTIEEWQHDLAAIDYHDALQAVREHRKASTDYLTANHVIRGVKRIREKRLEGFDASEVAYPGDPDDIPKYLAWRRSTISQVASGRLVIERPAIGRPIDLPDVTKRIEDVPDGDD